MKGFKAFNKDMTCKDMQYEIGKTYELGDTPICCQRGFHFCKSLADCYNYYDMSKDTRICEVEALGEIVTDDEVKYCTDKILIIKEIKNPREKSNTSKSSSGYCNSGDCNSGNCNSGDWNSGNRNSGNWNSGDWNSGNRNSGDWNSGYCNSGDWNSGDCNSGNRNSGNRNSGYWNSGDWNSGVFNTHKDPKIKMFDKESEWTINDWSNSYARSIMSRCTYTYLDFVSEVDMTDEEKENHPEYKTIGGYIKTFIATAEDKQEWWDNLSEDDKNEVKAIPNFDADKFCECVGIEHI